MKLSWNQLLRLAQEEVRGTTRRLPRALRPHAEALPVCYEPPVPTTPSSPTAGNPTCSVFFVGKAYGEEESGYADVPSQILLFLENLWDFAEEDEDIYREEVRTTYLHELGHYLGLDEIDLEARGLD
ncbi:MAG: metallopeptidase family protein [Verrucomicrobia bacterium]|nr:metallopeptidase family protein [Verrucomicrobiota bacterium]